LEDGPGTVAELLEAMQEFKRGSNEQWLIECHASPWPNRTRTDRAAA
jgi:hypothetical protein